MPCGTNKIPSAKIVPLIPQLTVRLGYPTATSETIETIKKTLTRLAVDHPHHTLDALALETGFAGRVNLYRAFKRKMGVSPTDWEAKVKA